MTQRDRWTNPRPVVARYRAYKEEVFLKAIPQMHLKDASKDFGEDVYIAFYLPMPSSWPAKQKKEMDGIPHQQKPDLDNLVKAILDIFYPEDCQVWHVTAVKRWTIGDGYIQIGRRFE